MKVCIRTLPEAANAYCELMMQVQEGLCEMLQVQEGLCEMLQVQEGLYEMLQVQEGLCEMFSGARRAV